MGSNVWVLLVFSLSGLLLLTRRRKKEARKDYGAFIEYFEILPTPRPDPPVAPQPLSNLTFAVKDIFDVEGFTTGFGNPDWAKAHKSATCTAPAITSLLEGGATCIGKTHMDELAYSINGENKHYGTPINLAAPSRVPGGSSSGSAVAVAAELVDFALGTDTGGSVRIPAAFCGILGFRPSHGAVPTAGVVPMAQSLDTIGWFARDPSILRTVGQVLLQLPQVDIRKPSCILIAEDCFKLSAIPQEESMDVAIKSLEKTFERKVVHMKLGEYIASKVPSLEVFLNEVNGKVDDGFSALTSLKDALRLLQRFEFKTNHEEWINNLMPDLGPGIAERVKAALETTSEEISLCLKVRDEIHIAFNELLKNDGVLVIPTAPGPPPKLCTREALLADFRDKAFCLLSIAGMSGCCQVSLPAGKYDGCPMAVSLIAQSGADQFLLDTVQKLYDILQKDFEGGESASGSTSSNMAKPEPAEAANEKGNIAFKNKDFRAAVDCYSEAIQLSGNNASYCINRAVAYLAMCSFRLAEADCSKALNLDKKNGKAFLRRGIARESLGRYRAAGEDFNHALVLEPTNKIAAKAVKRLNGNLYNQCTCRGWTLP